MTEPRKTDADSSTVKKILPVRMSIFVLHLKQCIISKLYLVIDFTQFNLFAIFQKVVGNNKMLARPCFRINEVVWGKIRGFVAWPAKIIDIDQRTYTIRWFNDYRTSKLFRSQIFSFYSNFEEFAKNFDKKIGLKTATQEAMMYLANPQNDIRN